MEFSIEEIRDLVWSLYVAQRQVMILEAEVARLQKQDEESTD